MRPFPIRALPARSRTVRFVLTAAIAAALWVTAACGSQQTSKPYTPSQGVNFDLGAVAVRNLVVVSTAAGQGILSATLLSQSSDKLIKVTGNPIKADGSDGAALTATGTVSVANNVVVLTDQSPITVKSADLSPGLSARLTLVFSTAGSKTVVVPIVSSQFPPYSTAVPSAAPSADA